MTRYYGTESRLSRALEAGYDPLPEDRLPPPLHQQTPPGVDALAEFAAEVQATPYACNDCNVAVHEDDLAPSCGSHYLCASCFETSDFGCKGCHRVWQEVTSA